MGKILKKGAIELTAGSIIAIILVVSAMVLAIVLVYQQFYASEKTAGKIDEKAAQEPLPLIESGAYPREGIAGTTFIITIKLVNPEDARDISIVKASIGSNIIVLYDDATHGDQEAGDSIYTGNFDSSESSDGILRGSITLMKAGKGLEYKNIISLEITPQACYNLRTSGEASDKVDVAIIGAEYADLASFKTDADKYLDFEGNKKGIFSYSPFTENSGKFNFYRVNKLYSLKDLNCKIGCNGVDSMICCDNPTLSRAASQCPSYDQILVLINRNEFCASSLGISSKVCTGINNDIRELTHEFGHSFGNLGDEYSYGIYPDLKDISASYNFPNCARDCSQWPAEINPDDSPEQHCYNVCGYDTYNRYTETSIMRDYVDYFGELNSYYLTKILDYYSSSDSANAEDAPAPPSGKQYMTEINYNNGVLTLNQIFLSPGQASDRKTGFGDYYLKIISLNGDIISSFKIDLPTLQKPFFNPNSTERPPMIELSEFNYTLNAPYYDNAKSIEVYDKNNEKVLDVDVSYFSKTCGNNFCESWENSIECSSDCRVNDAVVYVSN